jgi:hypothetical protein
MRTTLRYVKIGGVVLALACLVWVRFIRSASNREMRRAIGARRAAEYRALPADGGTDVKILQFYPEKVQVTAGERTLVCYGVQNARAVRIEPPVEQLDPVLNRCFWVAPKRSTTFQLVAEGANGVEVSQSLTITVNAAHPLHRDEQ